MPLDTVRSLVQHDLDAADACISQQLASSHIPLINEISQYVVQSGGKRLRPLLVLLGARVFDYAGAAHITLAAIIELIHTATLLHDDVVDASELRRGKQTANQVFGNETSILVGDYLYSRVFQMMVQLDNMPIMAVLAKATNVIVEGEILQLINRNHADITEDDYMNIIRRKTGALFEAAAQLGAVLCKRTETEISAMATYGLHLGIAFQLIDDALDYTSTSDVMGKKIGDDLAEGKVTLPLLHALHHASPEQATHIQSAIQHGGRDELELILTAIHATQAIEYTHQVAQQHIAMAIKPLSILPESPAQQALHTLASFTSERFF